MQVLATITTFRTARASTQGTLGLVPTMGYLHRGHMALVERASAENDVVAASIFVNPTQFGAGEDFASYPRDLDRDLSMLEAAGVSLVFTPTPEEMYRPGAETNVDPGPIANLHEGASRPGHFVGVATVVAKLFHIVKPDRAYFGQKDAQQLVIIKRMARDLDFDLDVVGVLTVREPDGLAISSRNVYLDPDQRVGPRPSSGKPSTPPSPSAARALAPAPRSRPRWPASSARNPWPASTTQPSPTPTPSQTSLP